MDDIRRFSIIIIFKETEVAEVEDKKIKPV
jgi:hypothetical protein